MIASADTPHRNLHSITRRVCAKHYKKGMWGQIYLQNGLKTGLVVVHVLLYFPALYVKDIDQYLHIAKYVVTLRGEVVLHEYLLTAQRKGTITEFDGGILDI